MAFKLLKTKISLGSMPPDPPSGAHWKFSTIRWRSNILLSSIKGKCYYLCTMHSFTGMDIAAGSIVYTYSHVYFIFRYLSELTMLHTVSLPQGHYRILRFIWWWMYQVHAIFWNLQLQFFKRAKKKSWHFFSRVDELVVAMYTPSDSKQIEER